MQDHLKAIFVKTGARTRGELVSKVFLEHYVPRREELAGAPPGCAGWASPPQAADVSKGYVQTGLGVIPAR